MHPLFNRRFAILWIVLLLSGVSSSAVIPLFPAYVEGELGRSPLFAANLRMMFFLLGGLAAIPAGVVCDSLGRKLTLVLGTTGAVTAGLLFVAHSPAALWALCLYSGLTSGVQATGSHTYLMGSVAKSHFGIGTAIFFIGHNLGNALGSRAAGLVAKSHGYTTMGQSLAVLALLAVLCTLAFLPSIPLHGETARGNIWRLQGFRRLLSRREIRLLLGIRFFPTFCWGSMSFAVPLILARLSDYDPRVPATYQTLYLVSAMCFQIVTGRLCDRFGRRWPLIISSVAIPLSVLALAASAKSVTAFYVFGITNASVAWSLSTIIPGLVNDCSQEEEKGQLMSLTHFCWSLGMATGTLMAGAVIGWGATMVFIISAAAASIPATAVVIRLSGNRQSSPAE
ncbi:MAG: hypothetical protein AUJ92_11115 [Armatimonadetes bacterium CG2_30_59_28]|nr:MFS transporter [Armatimonadota bacterium]OIO94003.1 MAG: hypothetical protein AUJ92_11115 [Armatimonadetes bacterium CG2_30_59_28]